MVHAELSKLVVCGIFIIYPLGAMAQYAGTIQHIPDDIRTLMIGKSWQPGCPVDLDDLRYVTVQYWDFQDQVQTGHLIVHTCIAQETIDIFEQLFMAHFPIERMELVDLYDADDDRSMAANNTSCFCCRAITNRSGVFSKHSYGLAFDINPACNPYVRGQQILPPCGVTFLDRSTELPGIVTDGPGNICYQAFIARGYVWGGSWLISKGYVDYQHFEKDPEEALCVKSQCL